MQRALLCTPSYTNATLQCLLLQFFPMCKTLEVFPNVQNFCSFSQYAKLLQFFSSQNAKLNQCRFEHQCTRRQIKIFAAWTKKLERALIQRCIKFISHHGSSPPSPLPSLIIKIMIMFETFIKN